MPIGHFWTDVYYVCIKHRHVYLLMHILIQRTVQTRVHMLVVRMYVQVLCARYIHCTLIM